MYKPSKTRNFALLLVLTSFSCTTGQGVPTPGTANTPFPIGTFKSLEYEINFNDDGEYIVFNEGDEVGRGTYSVTGDQVEFKDNYCGTDIGTYKWGFDENILTFEKIWEGCGERGTILPRLPWGR